MTTQDTPFQALDKALFSPAQPVAKTPRNTGRSQDSKETSKQGNKLPGKQTTSLERKQAPQAVSPTKKPPRRPIAFEPDVPRRRRLGRKQTFEFNKRELDFLDEVKFQLRELGVTKNEIVRTALELLAKDYEANKETSFLVRKFAEEPGNKLTQ
jgi:hypothetical protein